jgi:pentatricopeptide repeat protein
MPFKPFAHLARVSLAKGIGHSYAPSVVAAPTTLGLGNQPTVAKFTKGAHLQQSFASTSGSGAGAGAKTGHATSNATGGDGGLAQYWAAWQHAQQTGDDSDYKQHLKARTVTWKPKEDKAPQRLESIRPVDLLRPSARPVPSRVQSESALYDAKLVDGSAPDTAAERAVEIEELKSSLPLGTEFVIDEDVGTPLVSTRAASPVHNDSIASEGSQSHTPPTDATSAVSTDIDSLSDRIVQLGQQRRHAEIPAVFQSIVEHGSTPSVDAYNHILISAILSATEYQPWPKALAIWNDMKMRSVQPNAATFGILIEFLASTTLSVQRIQKRLDQRAARYGSATRPFVFQSVTDQQQIFADDVSLAFANTFYSIARSTSKNFSLSAAVYNSMVQACAQAGLLEQVTTLLADMKTNEVRIDPRHYTIIIDAYAKGQDAEAAQKVYEQYRSYAIRRAANDPQDMEVYASLIRAYYSAGQAETGLHFYGKILESFRGSSDEQLLSQNLTAAFVLSGLVQHHINSRAFDLAAAAVADYATDSHVREQAFSKVATAAADANVSSDATKTYALIKTAEAKAEPCMAIAAMHLRGSNVDGARAVWSEARGLHVRPTTDFATMYATALIRNGMVDEAISEARAMFAAIRLSATTEATRRNATAEIDEAFALFGQALHKTQANVSAQASVQLLRAMIENGGLVSPIAEHAVASLQPDCVHQLSAQDIGLALHVQAQILTLDQSIGMDAAHIQRFAHLVETVISRNIPLDPSTPLVVGEALPQLSSLRPDLESRWHLYRHPAPRSIETVPTTPVTPHAGFVPQSPVVDSYDPYGQLTDYRASKIISEMLESNAGRIESHLSDALARLRNVRRAGRHLHYTAYGKLLTAAGKARQVHKIADILAMAQNDTPFLPEVQAVRAGWVGIFDSAIAAYLTAGDRQTAAKYHQQLLDLGAAPSANTFGIYITTLEGTFDEATEAVKIFQRSVAEGVTPSVFLYNAVIGKLGKARRIDDCLRYFSEMQSLGMKPSSVTYGTLVNALCRTSEETFAVEMFDEMEAAQNYRPRPAPYNSIIQYFLNTKRDRSKVLEYYERMKSRNIKPTSHTYKLLVEAYASLEPVNLDAAEAVLDEMKQADVPPEAVHFGTLIHAKGCVTHDMVGARAIFDSIVSTGAIKLTDNLYQNLLEAMIANHQVDQTPEILEDMAARGVRMTPYIANTLIHGWAGADNIEKAKAIFNDLGAEKREPSTYEAMTRAYLSAEDHESANAVVQEMLRKGYPAAVSEKVLALLGSPHA